MLGVQDVLVFGDTRGVGVATRLQHGVWPRAHAHRDEGRTGVGTRRGDCRDFGDDVFGLDIPVEVGCDLVESAGRIVRAAHAVRPGAQVVLELGVVRVRVVVGAKQRQWSLVVVV